jgi:hypothetical protein
MVDRGRHFNTEKNHLRFQKEILPENTIKRRVNLNIEMRNGTQQQVPLKK